MKFKRKMNKSKSSQEENFLQLVCADINKKKIYVPSGTMKNMRRFGNYKTLEEYQKKYPTFKVEVNDDFFRQILQIVA